MNVRRAISLSFHHYKDACWGSDEVKNGSCENWLDMGLTIVDSLDTLWLVNMKTEFKEGVEWVSTSLNLEKWQINVFEVTIRILGGLLSAYALSHDIRLLGKAEDLGMRILSSWTPESMPRNSGRMQTTYSLAEVGSLQLEFRYLSHLTNNTTLKRLAIARPCWVYKQLFDQVRLHGVLTTRIDNYGGAVERSGRGVGAGADSFYEYILKTHLQDGRRFPCTYNLFRRARDEIRQRYMRSWDERTSYLIKVSPRNRVGHVMDHLDCFAPGMLALEYLTYRDASVLADAEKLMEGCWKLYNVSSTVGVEGVNFGSKQLRISNPSNMLRPEVAESLFYMHEATDNEKYRALGTIMFSQFMIHSRFGTRHQGAFCSMRDTAKPSCDGKMESFWIAETLKYLWLLQRNRRINLDNWVFNTEAHMFPVVSNLGRCGC